MAKRCQSHVRCRGLKILAWYRCAVRGIRVDLAIKCITTLYVHRWLLSASSHGPNVPGDNFE